MKSVFAALMGTALLASPAALACGGKSKSTASMETAELVGHHKKKDNLVDVAVGAGDFNTLVAAVQAADLAETLAYEGPFTVFAPTDAAFAALPEGTIDTLLMPENKDTLAGILTFHVVPGKVKAADLAGKVTTVTTVNGQELTIDGTNGVTVNGVAVTSADVMASNGVIHVIDGVLLPE